MNHFKKIYDKWSPTIAIAGWLATAFVLGWMVRAIYDELKTNREMWFSQQEYNVKANMAFEKAFKEDDDE